MADIHDLAAPYALDALDPGETRQFESHLETCERCRAELVELRRGVADIAEAVSVAPPPRVKSAVMQSVASRPAEVVALETRRPAVWFGAVAAGLAILFAGLWLVSNDRLGEADLVTAVYEAPDATFIEVDTGQGPVRFAYSPSLQRGVFNGGRLADTGENDLYQLWLIAGEGPVSAGTLRAGETSVLVQDVEPGVVLAMTVEMAPGADAPSGDPLFASEL